MAWWVWAIVGFGGILAELALPLFVLIWFGAAALVMMGLVLLVPDLGLATELFIWAVLSNLFAVAWFVTVRMRRAKNLSDSDFTTLVGEVGMLVEAGTDVHPGRVRFQKPVFGSDQWDCVVEGPCVVGDRVKVVRVQDRVFIVTKLEK